MKSIKDSFIEFIHGEDVRNDVVSFIKPLGTKLYNEMYPYMLFISIYVVILTFIILANLVILVRVLNHLGGFYVSQNTFVLE